MIFKTDDPNFSQENGKHCLWTGFAPFHPRLGSLPVVRFAFGQDEMVVLRSELYQNDGKTLARVREHAHSHSAEEK